MIHPPRNYNNPQQSFRNYQHPELHRGENGAAPHICVVIGGTHLGPVSNEQQEKSIDALKAFDIERLGVSHCTGQKTASRLAVEFGARFFFCNVGTVVEA